MLIARIYTSTCLVIFASCVFACSPTQAQSVSQPPGDQPKSPVAQFEAEVAQVKAEIEDLVAQRTKRTEQLYQRDVSIESYDEVLGSLQSQRIHLMIEMAGLDARQEMVAQLIADKQGRKTDAIAQKILEAAEQKLETAKSNLDAQQRLFDQGTVSLNDLAKFKNAALNAELEVLNARRELEHNNETNLTDSIKIEIALARAEASAKLNMVNQLLKNYVSARDELNSLERSTQQLESKRKQLSLLENHLLRLKSFEETPDENR